MARSIDASASGSAATEPRTIAPAMRPANVEREWRQLDAHRQPVAVQPIQIPPRAGAAIDDAIEPAAVERGIEQARAVRRRPRNQ